ncbi:phage protein [Aurantimonas coralicida]|uniref:phage protein n=1 Tax=Aurantimonas coralicida TaxID=182270 RepID=UPI001E5D867C|nr:hypothetical protein [Aurantimonas coralicida]MCD1645241.1 hypothetical protein [Aurantimonas coralicida]
MLQYGRKVTVAFQGTGGGFAVNADGGTQDQIRVAGTVIKGMSGTANTLELEVYNLAEGNRGAVGKELDVVTVEAGYISIVDGSSNVGMIFKGEIRDVEHRREGPDIITKVTCGDGDKALRTAVKSKTYPAGTKASEIIEDLHSEFEKQGIAKGEWKGIEDLPTYKRPYSVCGSCKREMDTLGRSHRFHWSLQNEAMEIVKGNGFIQSSAYVTPTTGLIGIPTITDNGVKFRALLNPDIRPNRMVVVESETLEMNSEGGSYRVSEVVYQFDNRDGDFVVDVTAEKISGGYVDEGRIPLPAAISENG